MANRKSSYEVISRKEALARGLKHYFTGTPCKRGHVGFRLVSSASCCKCQNGHQRKWRKKNREMAIAACARWFKNNKSRSNEDSKRYYWANREKRLQQSRSWYAANQERMRARSKKWRSQNPESVNAYTRNRKARLKANGGFHNGKDIKTILVSQKYKCAYCKIKLRNKYEVDHITPLSGGGSNNPCNLQIVCGPCNREKKAQDPIDYAKSLGLLI